MTVLYRAVWWATPTLPKAIAVESARRAFSLWASDDEAAPTLNDGAHAFGDRSVVVRSFADADSVGLEAIARDVETRRGGKTVWTTSLRLITDGTQVSTLVQNEMDTDEANRRAKVGRPRVVDSLLGLADSPWFGSSSLSALPMEINGSDVQPLVAVLEDPDRLLPVVVVGQSHDRSDRDSRRRSVKLATRLSGIATVILLSSSATDSFKKLRGALAVWDNALRIYMPGTLATSEGWRHRYVTSERLDKNEAGELDRVVFSIAQVSSRRRAPAVFHRFTAMSSSEDLEKVEFELDLERDDHAQTARELAELQGRYSRLVSVLREKDLERVIWETHELLEEDHVPDDASDISDAVLNCQLHLAKWVSLPDSAPRELTGIDTGPNSYSWGNSAWRGLRALAAFAQARANGFQGDFWAWCQSGEPLVWPATPKKLAMRESESVSNNKRFASARVFEVPQSVHPDGRVMMESHLKISEGGGDLAPRIYFYDDTAGTTKQVHVGFVGPHYLVPNTKS